MRKTIVAYLICWLTYLVLDWFWLAVAARELYRRGLGTNLSSSVQLWPLMVWYGVASLLVIVFIIRPAFKKDDLGRALARAALLGGALSAAFHLNSLALLNGWPVGLSLMGIIWGAVVTMAATAITHLSLRSKWLVTWL